MQDKFFSEYELQTDKSVRPSHDGSNVEALRIRPRGTNYQARTSFSGLILRRWFLSHWLWLITVLIILHEWMLEQDWILKSRKYRRSRCVATDSLNDQWFKSRPKRNFSRSNSSWCQVKPSWILESFIFITWRNQPWYKSAEESWTSCVTNPFHR